MEEEDQKSRIERLRAKKRIREKQFGSASFEETDSTSNSRRGGAPVEQSDSSKMAGSNQGSPGETSSPKDKSPFHAMFSIATDAWLQSNSLSEGGSSHTESTSPRPDPESRESEHPPSVERDIDGGEASKQDDSEAEGPIMPPPTPAPAPTFDDLSQPMESTDRDMNVVTEDEDAADKTTPNRQDLPPAQIFESIESIESMETTETQEDDYENLDANGSIISTEGRLTTNSSFDSLESMHSEIGSLDDLFEKMQKQKRRSSWSTYKSLSSSSTFSADDLRDVFIKDDKYSWVPAQVLEFQQGHAVVAIDPPANWKEATILQEEEMVSPSDLHPSMVDVLPGDVSCLCADNDLPRSQLRKASYKDYELEEFPLQNPPGEGKRDMADLLELHPASILYNLKDRHYAQKPYTRVGDIIIAMNPFVWLDDLYTTETRDTYSANLIWEAHKNALKEATDFSQRKSIYDELGFDPHVYETSALAYRDLAVTRQDQTILVTGESGAGKTETVKIVMNHLATVQQTRPGGVPTEHSAAKEIVDRVVKSSPVFEAFGNAKTVRNENSSRFGKFIQLVFEMESQSSAQAGQRVVPYTDLIGSSCVTYLLEKNRVVTHADGERTFHIFYQLLAAPQQFKGDLWSFFAGTSASDFSFTSGIDCGSRSKDAELWEETRAALELFKFEGENLKTLMRALAIVLQLGNMIFDYDPEKQEEGCATIKNKEDLARLSEMSGIDATNLEAALTSRVLRTRGHDDIKVGLSPQVAKECCDALAKEIYSKIFDLMVRIINVYTSSSTPLKVGKQTYGKVSLLDIFGFERFKVNRFEQLCINYANERLHHKYVLDNFNAVKDEYEAEGVDLYDFRLVDNTAILNLLEGKPGIIISLNEECLRPKGNPESFVYKMKAMHKASKILIDRKLHRRHEFGINHFTGPVEYNARNFVEHNMDKLPDDVITCASQSTNSIIREEFTLFLSSRESEPDGGNVAKKSKTGKRTVLAKFQAQLKSLLTAIEGTRTRYIRCIKPNASNVPRKTSQKTTMQQLECSGLMTALIMTRESFPNKLTYDFLRSRYSCLINEKQMPELRVMEPKEKVNHMLSKLLKPLSKKRRNGVRTMPYACGKTKVFFKAGAQDRLEELRSQLFEKNSVILQAWARRNNAVVVFANKKSKAIRIQACVRTALAVAEFQETRRKACKIQAWARKVAAMVAFADAKGKATVIQAWARQVNATRAFADKKSKACTLQAWARKVVAVSTFTDKRRKACKLQALVRKVLAAAAFAEKKRNARVIQSYARRAAAVAAYTEKRNRACEIQAWSRKIAAVVAFSDTKRKVCTLQSLARMSHARARLTQQREAATLIASWIRAYLAISLLRTKRRENNLLLIRSAVAIQTAARAWMAKRVYRRRLEAVQTSARGQVLTSTERPEVEISRAVEEAGVTMETRNVVDEKLQAELLDLRAQNSKLEKELESVQAENLRAEIKVLRARNMKLEEKLETTEAERDALASGRADDADESLADLNQRLQDLAETNEAVLKEAFKYRSEIKKLKRRQKSESIQAASKLSVAEEALEEAEKSRETEVEALTATIKENEKSFDEERISLKREVSSLKKQNAKDIEALAEELRKTHESHQEYLTELMDTLEKTHTMRVQETEKISKELEAAKAQKDREIRVLKQEVRLLVARKGGLQNIKSVLNVRSIRRDLNEESESRARRSAQFDDAVQTLTSLVAESSPLPSDDAEDYDIKQIAEQQERAQKMSDVIEMLNAIYKTEEEVREEKNQTALDMIDEYVAVTEPDRRIRELRERLAEEEFMAAKLREELKEKEVCKRCEVRNAAARRRIQRSGHE